MAASWMSRMLKRKSRPVARSACKQPNQGRFVPALESLSDRIVPAAFNFSTGLPDGKVATISEPPNPHNSQVEFESADDFVLNTETVIDRASFTGLLTGGATPKDVSNVVLTIYRVLDRKSTRLNSSH